MYVDFRIDGYFKVPKLKELPKKDLNPNLPKGGGGRMDPSNWKSKYLENGLCHQKIIW